MRVIETRDLFKHYYDNEITTEVLRGINLCIETGEFVSIVGPSGSGKTTLLYVLSGLEAKTKGSIKLFGKEIEEYSDKELSNHKQNKIGFIFQFYNLLPNLTVYDNILLAQVLANNQNNERIEELLHYVGLANYHDYYPNQLSGGMQQRVAIARALVNDPMVIFADEPTGNLDIKNSLAIMELFQKLNQELHKTIVLVTHNEDLIKYGTRYLRLVDGVIINDEIINK